MKPRAALAGDCVIVAEPAHANRIYNKGFAGEPQPGNSLRLAPEEAAWLVAEGRLQVFDGEAELAWHQLLGDDTAVTRYLALSDLRSRGLIVKPIEGGLAVWGRGITPPEPHEWTVATISSDSQGSSDFVAGLLEFTKLAVVDQEGEVTYYTAEEVYPAGNSSSQAPLELQSFGNKFIAESGAQAGVGHRDKRIVSSIQARAQAGEEGVVETVFSDLQARGLAVRSGFRFGTQLRAYEGEIDQTHAPWLIDVIDDSQLAWYMVARGVRLAHGVRKRYLLALPGNNVRYIALDWFKP